MHAQSFRRLYGQLPALRIEARTDRVFVRLCQQAKLTGRAEDRAGGELGLGVWCPAIESLSNSWAWLGLPDHGL